MSLGVLQQEPNPDQTQIPVPTSPGGIWDSLKGVLSPIWSFLKWLFEFLITFTIGNGGIVAGIILVFLALWVWKIPKLRGILLFLGGIIIAVWFMRYVL